MRYIWIDGTEPSSLAPATATVVTTGETSSAVVGSAMELHPSNTRHTSPAAVKTYALHEPWLGFEQEDAFFQSSRPLGWPATGFPTRQSP